MACISVYIRFPLAIHLDYALSLVLDNRSSGRCCGDRTVAIAVGIVAYREASLHCLGDRSNVWGGGNRIRSSRLLAKLAEGIVLPKRRRGHGRGEESPIEIKDVENYYYCNNRVGILPKM